MRVWQFLPLGPVGYGNSPYQPLSVYAGNEMLIGIDELIDGGFLTHDEVRELRELPHDRTDYNALVPLKSEVLQRAAGRFSDRAGLQQKVDFEQFVAEHDDTWLHTYSLFRVLKTLHGEHAWTTWSADYAHRNAAALERICDSANDQIHRYKVLQFWFYSQWRQLRTFANEQGVALMGDMPIYIALDSADAWSHRELLALDSDGQPTSVAGVPPDYFSEDGQLWGNPIYDWPYHAETGYAWWAERIQAMLTHVDMIRLDHFRGFESYWSVPAAAETARDGTWLPGPADGLFEALRNQLGDLPLIAEDLGIITDEVRAFLHRWGFPGMSVLQFMAGNEGFHQGEIGENTVCYTGTHDNDTTVGWFHGGGIEQRNEDELAHMQALVLANVGGQPDTIHLDMVRFALHSQALIGMFPLQDILGLGSDSRMNTPGTTDDNWAWRLSEPQTTLNKELRDRIREMVQSSGRTI